MKNYIAIHQWIDCYSEQETEFDGLKQVEEFLESYSEYLNYCDVFDRDNNLVRDINGYKAVHL